MNGTGANAGAAVAAEVRANVLRMYRRLLKLSSRATPDQAVKFRIQIRTKFRESSGIQDPVAIEEMLKSANSTLGYLRMITPREKTNDVEERISRMVVGEDKKLSSRKAVTNWSGSNMDPDSVRRHYAGLKRAGFKNNAHAKGMF
jgi:hypothetical protein